MQWNKYTDLIGSEPAISLMLAEHVGPRAHLLSGYSTEETIREWVEQKLKYVAIRPWESIEMDVVDVTENRRISRHALYYHIKNGDPHQCHRARFLTHEHFSPSLREVICDTVEWHTEYWAKRTDCPLVFDAVMRKQEVWRKVSRWTDELVETSVDIWLPPVGFQL